MNDLNTTVLCNMYDFYRDYTAILSTIQPYDPRHANYSYAQFVALKAMQSACQWVREMACRDACLYVVANLVRTPYNINVHHT